jgi:hypothetical protein
LLGVVVQFPPPRELVFVARPFTAQIRGFAAPDPQLCRLFRGFAACSAALPPVPRLRRLFRGFAA